jgi:Amt family ammonium transporter
LSGSICYYCVNLIKFKLQIDDSLDVMAVHGVGGILGTLLAGILASETFGGLGLEKTVMQQTIVQAIGVVSVVAFSAIVTYVICLITKSIFGLRVAEEQEISEGLDLGTHGEQSYRF